MEAFLKLGWGLEARLRQYSEGPYAPYDVPWTDDKVLLIREFIESDGLDARGLQRFRITQKGLAALARGDSED